MKSHINDDFRKALDALPVAIQERTRAAYRRFQQDPWHRSLQFKQVKDNPPIYSVRINRQYRALGILDAGDIHWFWIGSHAEYDRLIG